MLAPANRLDSIAFDEDTSVIVLRQKDHLGERYYKLWRGIWSFLGRRSVVRNRLQVDLFAEGVRALQESSCGN